MKPPEGPLDFWVLGPLVVRRERWPIVLSAKQKALVALLVVGADGVVSVDRLLEALWPESPREHGHALQALVSRLRTALGGAHTISYEPPCYRLNVDPDRIDSHRFERLTGEALASGDPAQASTLLAEALALWRGPALADAGEDEWTDGERARLEDLRQRALEKRIEADLELGRHERVIPELQAAIAEHPLRERLRAQLALALYRSDRQADALDALRAARRHLREELGLEPGPELRRLERLILSQDAALTPAARRARPATNLPAPLSPTIGRERDVAEVRRTLAGREARLLTLTGPGGVGKTRLALEAARGVAGAFPSGIVLVDLSALSDPALVGPTVAEALGWSAPTLAELAALLPRSVDEEPLLVVLDGVERVAGAGPELGGLLAAVPGLTLLATSRVALRIAAEHVFPVRPLSEDGAMELFSERARAAGAGSVPARDVDAVRAICRRLDCLPLAIELAADGTRVLSPAALVARLAHPLDVLGGGRRDLPPRQRSLRATLDWSWQLLQPAERTLLTRLSVFAGGATLEAAEAVCNPDRELADDVLSLAAGLLDKAVLLRADAGADEPSRFGMLDTIREYAEEQAAGAGELDELRARHARYFLSFAEQAAAHTGTMDRRMWLDRQARERDNVRAARSFFLRSDDDEAVLRLAVAFGSALPYDAHAEEVRGWLDAALDAGGAPPSPLRAAGFYWSGCLAQSQGDYAAAEARLEDAGRLSRDLGDVAARADALTARGFAATMRGDESARRWSEEGLALARESGDPRRIGAALSTLAGSYERDADWERAQALTEEALALYRKAGDPDGLARALTDIGWYALVAGELEDAERYLEESLRLRRRRGDERQLGETLANIAWLAYARGDADEAVRRFLECFELARHVDDRFDVGECLGGLSAVAAMRGDHELAGQLHGAELAVHDALGAPRWESVGALQERGLAEAEAALGATAFHAAVAAGRGLTPDQAVARGGSRKAVSTIVPLRAVTAADAGA